MEKYEVNTLAFLGIKLLEKIISVLIPKEILSIFLLKLKKIKTNTIKVNLIEVKKKSKVKKNTRI